MTEEEFRARQRARRLQRQRQLRRRLAIGIAVIAVVIIVIVAAAVTHHKKAASKAAAETELTDNNQSTASSTDATDASAADTTDTAATDEAATDTTDAAATDTTDAAATDTADAAATDTADTAATDTAATDPASADTASTETADAAAAETPVVTPALTVPETDRSDFAVTPGLACGVDTPTDEKIVYLTLDDGPSELTEQVLDICDRYNIKITFFVTNQNPEYAYLIKEAYDRGHTIGLHTYCHDYGTVYASVDAYFADLDAIGQVVAEQIGYVPCFIRFPGGSSNYISHDYSEGIMTTLTQEVQARGYQYFDWNASSGDGGDCTDPAQLAAAATSFDYYDNIVLLSHDGADHEATIEALPTIIEHYLSLGYEFRPLSRSAYTAHHSLTN